MVITIITTIVITIVTSVLINYGVFSIYIYIYMMYTGMHKKHD